MKAFGFLIVATTIACAGLAAAAQDNMYAVGPFNGWDAKSPLAFERAADGTFCITLDFTQSREFKMSTVSGAGSGGNGWTEFDSGALKPVSTPALGEWTAIEKNHNGNISAPESRSLTVQVDLAAMRMRYVRSTAPEYSGTLPVLFIDTEGGAPITTKETYLQATYHLDPMGHGDVQAIGSAEAPLTMQIRGRGNYTWTGFDKKPYRLKLTDKQPLLGMTKSRHFVLLAHADDRVGFMRNTLGFAASRSLGLPWTPAQEPVEVVLNGDYIGLYFLTENIRVDKDRVNVTEQEDLATTDVSGGWLVEIDNYDADPHVTVMEGSYPIWFTYKSPEVLSSEQTEFLQGQMQSVQDAIAKKDYAALARLVDTDMLARYYIVQEIMNDYESFHGSCYLNRQRGDAEMWKFGPVWDFGSALMRDDNNYIYESEYHQVWIGSICKGMPEFTEVVKKVWAEFLGAGGTDALVAYGKGVAAEIDAAAKANYRRWPDYGNADEAASAQTAFDRMQSKSDWLKERWGDTGGIGDAVAGDENGMRIYSSGGTLFIDAVHEGRVVLATPDGRSRMLQISAGTNTVDGLERGIYIVGGRKIAI